MLSVRQAIETILDGVMALDEERVELEQLTGRIAAVDHLAQITQPPFAASAMDGYAVRFKDAHLNNELKVVGEVRAGSAADVELGERQAVRIFTGGIVPNGADHVIIQEDVQRLEDTIIVTETQMRPRNIRKAGVDFVEGTVLAQTGDYLNEIHGALFAGANLTHGRCIKKPTVAFFSNGDELREPGTLLEPGQVINSNRYALSALVRSWGGIPASAIVAATLFLKPVVQRLAGYKSRRNVGYEAITNTLLPANGARETYLPASLCHVEGKQGFPSVTQYHSQDSSLLLSFGTCEALIRREINAPQVEVGERAEVISRVDCRG